MNHAPTLMQQAMFGVAHLDNSYFLHYTIIFAFVRFNNTICTSS
jgi:hypothetical protein